MKSVPIPYLGLSENCLPPKNPDFIIIYPSGIFILGEVFPFFDTQITIWLVNDVSIPKNVPKNVYDIINYIYIPVFCVRKKERQKKPNSPQTVPSPQTPQEFMILPVGAASFREALQIGAEVWPAPFKRCRDTGS